MRDAECEDDDRSRARTKQLSSTLLDLPTAGDDIVDEQNTLSAEVGRGKAAADPREARLRLVVPIVLIVEHLVQDVPSLEYA